MASLGLVWLVWRRDVLVGVYSELQAAEEGARKYREAWKPDEITLIIVPEPVLA